MCGLDVAMTVAGEPGNGQVAAEGNVVDGYGTAEVHQNEANLAS
jgi:hypothetical protein